jgi:hypothetical protein
MSNKRQCVNSTNSTNVKKFPNFVSLLSHLPNEAQNLILQYSPKEILKDQETFFHYTTNNLLLKKALHNSLGRNINIYDSIAEVTAESEVPDKIIFIYKSIAWNFSRDLVDNYSIITWLYNNIKIFLLSEPSPRWTALKRVFSSIFDRNIRNASLYIIVYRVLIEHRLYTPIVALFNYRKYKPTPRNFQIFWKCIFPYLFTEPDLIKYSSYTQFTEDEKAQTQLIEEINKGLNDFVKRLS